MHFLINVFKALSVGLGCLAMLAGFETPAFAAESRISVGLDRLFCMPYCQWIKGKRVGLICNQTAIDGQHRHAVQCLSNQEGEMGFKLVALFSPEHGIRGEWPAEHRMNGDEKSREGIPIFSLHGSRFRPTPEMLAQIDLFIFDMQDVGSRSYTYLSTLLMALEEATKAHIPFVVLDRPNPLGGLLVDGPMLEEKWRSIVGYLNVPYCHGMTLGELALYYNEKYAIGADLKVVPMAGWRRAMPFSETGLTWVPTSPNIPEMTTPFFYPCTGILGELQVISIGIGTTLPFKVFGAPWIDADALTQALNGQKFPGVHFLPFYFRPMKGKFSGETCNGAMIVVTDVRKIRPVEIQFLIIGILKTLYPDKFAEGLKEFAKRKEMFCKVMGSERYYDLIEKGKYVVWPAKEMDQKGREVFLEERKRFLLYK